MTIQGRRMPSRDDVRSLILPKNGLPTIARKAPIPATTERLCGARSIPTSELIFNANVTSNGARNNRQVPMYASAYTTTNPHRTRRTTDDTRAGATGWDGSGAVSLVLTIGGGARNTAAVSASVSSPDRKSTRLNSSHGYISY